MMSAAEPLLWGDHNAPDDDDTHPDASSKDRHHSNFYSHSDGVSDDGFTNPATTTPPIRCQVPTRRLAWVVLAALLLCYALVVGTAIQINVCSTDMGTVDRKDGTQRAAHLWRVKSSIGAKLGSERRLGSATVVSLGTGTTVELTDAAPILEPPFATPRVQVLRYVCYTVCACMTMELDLCAPQGSTHAGHQVPLPRSGKWSTLWWM